MFALVHHLSTTLSALQQFLNLSTDEHLSPIQSPSTSHRYACSPCPCYDHCVRAHQPIYFVCVGEGVLCARTHAGNNKYIGLLGKTSLGRNLSVWHPPLGFLEVFFGRMPVFSYTWALCSRTGWAHGLKTLPCREGSPLATSLQNQQKLLGTFAFVNH